LLTIITFVLTQQQEVKLLIIFNFQDEDDYSASALGQPKRATYTAPVALLNDIPQGEQVWYCPLVVLANVVT
jgi:hypothetical protein